MLPAAIFFFDFFLFLINCCPGPVSSHSGHSVPWNVPITHNHIIRHPGQLPDMKHLHERQIWFPANSLKLIVNQCFLNFLLVSIGLNKMYELTLQS